MKRIVAIVRKLSSYIFCVEDLKKPIYGLSQVDIIKDHRPQARIGVKYGRGFGVQISVKAAKAQQPLFQTRRTLLR